MNRPTKKNKNPPKIEKPKGSVTLGRTTFIDEIFKRTTSRKPTSSLQAAESPSEAFAKIHNQKNGIEQDSQEIENPCISFLQEGIPSNL